MLDDSTKIILLDDMLDDQLNNLLDNYFYPFKK